MRYIYYCVLAILCIGLVSACVVEEESVGSVDGQLVHKVFDATFEDSDMTTKTVLDETVGENGFRGLLWDSGDEIGVAGYGGYYQKFTNALGELSAIGVFDGYIDQTSQYYAIYPYTDMQRHGTSVSVTVPTVQTYRVNSFDRNMAPMVGKGNDGERLHFMNLCGVLAVQLTGSETIKSIVFQTKNGEMVSGICSVDPDYADYPVLDTSTATETYVTLDCGKGVQLGGEATPFHIVLPPGTYNGFTLYITTADGKFMKKETSKTLTIKRSIVTKAASFAFENNMTDVTNLSERGHSNCYIVPAAGLYSFDANIIGNGEFGLIEGGGFHTNNPSISPVSVDLLWEDNVEDCIDWMTMLGDKVLFKSNGEKGNALIAVRDEMSNIIWSWHIWMIDDLAEQLYVSSTSSYYVLDRNLGALRNNRGEGEQWKDSRGLLYFWGRKDPFWYEQYSQTSGFLTLQSSISNPTLRHTTGSWTSSTTSWLGDYNHIPFLWSDTKKTIYDPCPVGYRVAVNDVFSGFTSTGSLSSSTEDFNVLGEYDNGFNFYIDNSKQKTAWYPSSHYMNWSSHHVEPDNEGRLWTADYTSIPHKYTFYISADQVGINESSDGHGYPVRCMKDESYVDVSLPQVMFTFVDYITGSSAKLIADIKSEGHSSVIEKGFIYSLTPEMNDGIKVQCGSGTGEFSHVLTGLNNETTYYVKAYAINSYGEAQSNVRTFKPIAQGDIVNLSVSETANCYILPQSGTYSFNTMIGNSNECVEDVSSVEVLWETFGTDEKPEVGSLIRNVSYYNGVLLFDVPEPYYTGNAVIAAKDVSGRILWSWHMWLTDQPKEQVYPNNAGTMMDRNLGATSAILYDLSEWGLLYQWGRKDPFLGTYSSRNVIEAKSTINWPRAVISDSECGTIEYAVQFPTTYIIGNGDNSDWYYTGTSNNDDTRWQSNKTIYDPCPIGWRVPDGGENGIWNLADISFQHRDYYGTWLCDNYGDRFAWYPVNARRDPYNDGRLYNSNPYGYYWSVTPDGKYAYVLEIGLYRSFNPTSSLERAGGHAVRCMKDE